ncbi:TetR/AcrR family transcriptional regulator [Desulfosporosinus meridiei]|uniref:Transcriptional regulator n=1 Tax=Desulfosporosinus meridiei (strain ATCC BAA-275 / DSM 13257 / KCTC 12902 / NCIMB 13706 / S10) TaxID=768704 RepID=J7IUR1_DESMD|nr:TetR/AcrR family transcriptional regulator [Desulfosporosinus meridiei]AFQ45470.1 transcriptional regulator [Desulfosporosinus meridiei DSM 13257]
MYENFENLKEDKKKKILDACIFEFADKGYDKASTNAITNEAGISKGILFHYFKNKKALFNYVLDYCMQTMTEEFMKYPLTETKDIFQRFSELGVIKLKIAQEYPYIVKLFMEALVSPPEDMRSEIEKKYLQASKRYMTTFFKDIDYSKFRSGVEPSKAIEVITLFIGALGEKYLKDYKGKEHELFQDYDKIMAEYMGYMEILKYGMYSSDSTN